VNITSFIIESPGWVKYLIWLAAISLDMMLEQITFGAFSLTKGISFIFNSILGFASPGLSIDFDAMALFVFSVALGVFMGVLWFAGSRK
jgi:hypothetical protein